MEAIYQSVFGACLAAGMPLCSSENIAETAMNEYIRHCTVAVGRFTDPACAASFAGYLRRRHGTAGEVNVIPWNGAHNVQVAGYPCETRRLMAIEAHSFGAGWAR